jgi:hypothetical protein
LSVCEAAAPDNGYCKVSKVLLRFGIKPEPARTKRQVVTAKGTICCKGFTYQYRLNKQGISYCEYLRRPKFGRDLEQEIRRKDITLKGFSSYFIMKEAGKVIGPANGIALLKVAEYFSSYLSVQLFKGRYKRFPPQRDDERFFLMFTLLARREGLDQGSFQHLFVPFG